MLSSKSAQFLEYMDLKTRTITVGGISRRGSVDSNDWRRRRSISNCCIRLASMARCSSSCRRRSILRLRTATSSSSVGPTPMGVGAPTRWLAEHNCGWRSLASFFANFRRRRSISNSFSTSLRTCFSRRIALQLLPQLWLLVRADRPQL